MRQTRDYVNTQLGTNRVLISRLYADAQLRQTRLEFFCPSEEKLQLLRAYGENEQEIRMALDYNVSVTEKIQAFSKQGKSTQIVEDILATLAFQQRDLEFALGLNRVLHGVLDDCYNLANEEASRLISLVGSGEKLADLDKSRLATIYNLRGMIQFREEVVKAGRESELFKKAIDTVISDNFLMAKKYKPNDHYSNIHMAYAYRTLYAAKGINPELAELYLEKIKSNVFTAYQIAPHNISTLNTMGLYKRLLNSLEDDLAALAYFEEALDSSRKNACVLHNLSRVHLSLGERKGDLSHFKTAYDYAQNANELKPADISILGAYVEAAARCGKCKEAESALEKLKVVTVEHNRGKHHKNKMVDETDHDVDMRAKAVFMERCQRARYRC